MRLTLLSEFESDLVVHLIPDHIPCSISFIGKVTPMKKILGKPKKISLMLQKQ
jgi:hypothetical protein